MIPGSFTSDIGRVSTVLDTGYWDQDLKVDSMKNTDRKRETITMIIQNPLPQSDLDVDIKDRPAKDEDSKHSLARANGNENSYN